MAVIPKQNENFHLVLVKALNRGKEIVLPLTLQEIEDLRFIALSAVSLLGDVVFDNIGEGPESHSATEALQEIKECKGFEEIELQGSI